jgi:hypothetical protein
MKPRHSFTADVLAYFKARPNVWIDAGTLQDVGGRFASRTRISEVRKRLEAAGEGTIENRTSRMSSEWAASVAESSYRYVPAVPVEPLTATPHDLNRLVPGDGRLW